METQPECQRPGAGPALALELMHLTDVPHESVFLDWATPR
jgi:hypothetical protein